MTLLKVLYTRLEATGRPAADHPITGNACGTSGSRELCRGRVPEEPTARLQAAGIGTIDASLSSAEGSAGRGVANAVERVGRPADAVRVSAIDGDAGAGRRGGQSQASIPAVSRGRLGDEDSAAAADPLEWRSG